MRRILVDHARAHRAQKRGGPATRVTFDQALVVTNEPRADFVALDDALLALAAFDERKGRTVARNREARLAAGKWLQREMRGDRSHDA